MEKEERFGYRKITQKWPRGIICLEQEKEKSLEKGDNRTLRKTPLDREV